MVKIQSILRFIRSNPPRSIGGFLALTSLYLYFMKIINDRVLFLFLITGYAILYFLGPTFYRKKEEKKKKIMIGDFKLLQSDRNYTTIELLQSHLESNGITTVILNKELGDMPWDQEGVSLYVKSEDYNQAIKLLS